jgi:hypothetical protein
MMGRNGGVTGGSGIVGVTGGSGIVGVTGGDGSGRPSGRQDAVPAKSMEVCAAAVCGTMTRASVKRIGVTIVRMILNSQSCRPLRPIVILVKFGSTRGPTGR